MRTYIYASFMVLIGSCASQNAQNARIAALEAKIDSLSREKEVSHAKAQFLEEEQKKMDTMLSEARKQESNTPTPEEVETPSLSKEESDEFVAAFLEKFDNRPKFVYGILQVEENRWPSKDTVTYFSKVYEFKRWNTDAKYKFLDDIESLLLLRAYPESKVISRQAKPFLTYTEASRNLEHMKRQ